MKATFKLFHEYMYVSDRPQDDYYNAVTKFLTELGPDRLIGLTQTKLTITVWFWDGVAQVINDSKIRCRVVGIPPTVVSLVPPRKGEPMCREAG